VENFKTLGIVSVKFSKLHVLTTCRLYHVTSSLLQPHSVMSAYTVVKGVK